MNTGILEDGSLSSRLKGDLYWRKQKLILRAEAGNTKVKKGTKFFVSRFASDEEIAVGSNTIDAIEEISDEEGGNVCIPDSSVRITEKNVLPGSLSDYPGMIPENYMEQIENSSLKVTAYDMDGDFLAVSITGVHSGWLEIVWVTFKEVKVENAKKLLSYMIYTAKEKGIYRGIFAELHMAPETELMKQVLSACGMHIHERKNNLYECRMEDVVEDKTLTAAASKISCMPLLFFSEPELDEIEQIIYEEAGSVPVPLPIPWGNYRQDLSIVHYDPEKKSLGLFLVSKVGDTFVIDLMYGKNPMVTAAILGTVVKTAKEELENNQKILVPIVLEATRPLVEKLAPTATREDLVSAFVKF